MAARSAGLLRMRGCAMATSFPSMPSRRPTGAFGLSNAPASPGSRLWGYARGMPDSPTDDAFHEETTDPLVADARNFYEVEKWTPAAHPRERTRVLDQYPPRP